MNKNVKIFLAVVVGFAVFGAAYFGLLKGGKGELIVNGKLTLTVDPSTPNEDIILTNAQSVPVATFRATADKEAFVIKKLTFWNQDGVLGDTDNNIKSVSLVTSENGQDVVQATGSLIKGKVTFAGQNITVPKDGFKLLKLSVDTNSMKTVAKPGQKIRLNLRFVEAVGAGSGVALTVSNSSKIAPNFFHVHGVKPVITLAGNSPSGPKTVSDNDTGLIFNLAAVSNENEGLKVRSMAVNIESDASLALSGNPTATLQGAPGAVIGGPSTIQYSTSSYAKISFVAPSIDVPAGTSKQISVVYNSADSVNDQTLIDDLVIFAMSYGSSKGGTIIPGSVTWVEKDSGIGAQWFGNVSTIMFTGNTLKY